jgi:Leucine-rich repeat (LRR) protein
MDLSGNKIGGVITADHFANLSSLEDIYLANNPLKVVVNPEWRPLFSLRGASFASCQMGPLFPSWLKWQVNISYLDISSAGIADRLPDWFCTSFANVRKIVLSENGINGSLPTNMNVMTPLRRLYLDSNQLTGQIPQLPVGLSMLDMSRNSLSSLPSNFGAPYIQELKLYSNLLTGHIPESICGLHGTDMILDLSNNYLEGGFPPCFRPMDPWILIFINNRFTGKFRSFAQRCKSIYILDLSLTRV